VTKTLKLYFSFSPIIIFAILLSYLSYQLGNYRLISIEQYLLTFTYGDLVIFNGVILSPLSQILYVPYMFLDRDQFMVLNIFALALFVFSLHSKYMKKFDFFDIRFLALTSVVNGFILMLIFENVYFVPFLLLIYYLVLVIEPFNSKSNQFLFAYSLFVNPIMLLLSKKFSRETLKIIFLTIITMLVTILSVSRVEVIDILFQDFSWISFAQYTLFPISIFYAFTKAIKSSLYKTLLLFIATLILLLWQKLDVHAGIFYLEAAFIFLFQIFLVKRYRPNRSEV